MNKHTTKALITSLLSMLLCVSMLIGSTFAWFTDTATTGVNTIMSGNLDVALEMFKDGKWVNAEGETLDFVKAAGAPEDEEILWEPGCTYELPKLRVVNNGNLVLKYQIQITGIQGDAKLNEAIEWTIDGADVGETYVLLAGEPKEITIKGHMKEEAGNEYKNLTIEGIAITVLATQKDAEYDSFDNDYDATAPQLVSLNDELYDTLDKAIAAAANGDTIKLQGIHTLPSVSDKTITFSGIDGAAVLSIPAGVKATGSTLTFDNLTVQGYDKEDTFYTTQLYGGAVKATYKNCTIKGLIVTYCDSDFVDCVFENTFADQYSVFCYGGSTFTITGCTFNTPCSKAVKLYNEGTGKMTLEVKDCEFFAYKTDKAAIEIDSRFTEGYIVKIEDCKINEYYDLLVNDKSNKSTITVDGTPVVILKDATDLNDTIANAGSDPVGVVLPAGEYTLPTLSNKNVTISGGKDTVIDLTNFVTAHGSTVTMEGVTVNVNGDGTYKGIQHAEKVVYNNVTFNGTQFLYSDAEFTNCTFNVTGDKYNIWVYGNNATFTNCTFNCDGKAVLQYNEGNVNATVTFNKCEFNDSGVLKEKDGSDLKKAAVEVGESANGKQATYTINLNDCTVNGFDVTGQNASTFGGTNLGTNLWGNKNLMPADRLNIIVDGTEVY